jgi:hypothetical protein
MQSHCDFFVCCICLCGIFGGAWSVLISPNHYNSPTCSPPPLPVLLFRYLFTVSTGDTPMRRIFGSLPPVSQSQSVPTPLPPRISKWGYSPPCKEATVKTCAPSLRQISSTSKGWFATLPFHLRYLSGLAISTQQSATSASAYAQQSAAFITLKALAYMH